MTALPTQPERSRRVASRPNYADLPPVTRSDISRDLSALGLKHGDTVLVHSAMSRIGHIQGGAEAVIDAFLDVLGPDGTLAVPTFPFRGGLLAYVRGDPEFDVDATPSLMGSISEATRKRPGAVRSLEPTHPVAALGRQARFLTEAHLHGAGPCDEHSPLFRLTLAGGYVLLLGVDFRNCTLLHTAEELARVPFIDFTTRYRLRGRASSGDYAMQIYCHSTPLRANFPAIEPVLLQRGVLTIGRVGVAEARLALASDILQAALDLLAQDPYALRQRPATAPS